MCQLYVSRGTITLNYNYILNKKKKKKKFKKLLIHGILYLNLNLIKPKEYILFFSFLINQFLRTCLTEFCECGTLTHCLLTFSFIPYMHVESGKTI